MVDLSEAKEQAIDAIRKEARGAPHPIHARVDAAAKDLLQLPLLSLSSLSFWLFLPHPSPLPLPSLSSAGPLAALPAHSPLSPSGSSSSSPPPAV